MPHALCIPLICAATLRQRTTMTTRLTLAIQERFDKLSPSERKLAALLLDRADDMLTFSATELAAMAEVSKDATFLARTASLGIVPTARGPKEFAAYIKQEVETNTALLKEANYKPE